MRSLVLVFVLGLTVGCGESSPPQPKLTDSQVQDVMKQGKQQIQKEGGNRIPKQ